MRIPVSLFVACCLASMPAPGAFAQAALSPLSDAERACDDALAKLERADAASKTKLLGMKEPPALKAQYEQDMYFARERQRLGETTCAQMPGRAGLSEFGRKTFEKNKSMCAMVATGCKATKHW